MARFDPFVIHTLNKMFSVHFIDEIKTDLNEILPLIISGNLSVPKKNLINNELLEALHIDECKFQKQLTEDSTNSGIRNKVGFNKLTIISMFLREDVKHFLNDLDSQYTLSSIQLSKLKELCNGNMVYGKLLSQMTNGFGRLLIEPITDDDLKYQIFKYIYNRIEDVESDSGTIAFLYLYSFLVLYSAYSKINKFQTEVFYHISDNGRLTIDQIGSEFESYYLNNQSSLINDVGNYCYRNIFQFNYDYSALFDNTVDVGISLSFSNLFTLFKDNITLFINEDFTSGLLFLISDQICLNTAEYWMRDESESFYEYLPNLYNVDIFGTVILEEDYIYAETMNYLSFNLDELEQLEYIAFQFNADPIYFINSYIYLHYVYSSDVVDKMKLAFDIGEWYEKLDFTSDRNSKFNEYLENHQFVYSDDLVKRAALLSFADVIRDFISSEEVTEWIISDFFPALLNSIKINYHVNIDVYNYVDDIKCILNFKLITELFNDNIWETYIIEFSNYISGFIVDYNVDISDSNYNLIFNSIPKDKVEGILNGIFKSASINNYLKSLFSKYAI